MKELDQRAMELQQAEEDCRRAINVAVKDYNKALVSAIFCIGKALNHCLEW